MKRCVCVQVVLEARRVCGRRLFVYRGRVARAHKPLYLLIDAAIAVCTTILYGLLTSTRYDIPNIFKHYIFSVKVRREQYEAG